MTKKTVTFTAKTAKMSKAKPLTSKKQTARRRKRKRKGFRTFLYILGFCVLLFATGVGFGYHFFHHQNVTIDAMRYPVRGIDVSAHNGDIDFTAVAAEDFQFVLLRASYGNHDDKQFERYYAEATANGLDVGAYHYLRFNTDGVKQAERFYKCIKDKKLQLPAVIDIEDWGNSLFVKKETRIQVINDMVTALKSREVRVMLYTNLTGYRQYIANTDLEQEPLWLSALRQPEEVTDPEWTLLQYSHTGTVNGISGEVDLDIFKGSQNEWKQWIAK